MGGNAARWINHACEPNCQADEVDGRVFISALADLSPGEELFYDYGLVIDERYTPKLKKQYECRCGSPRCRGTMLGQEALSHDRRAATCTGAPMRCGSAWSRCCRGSAWRCWRVPNPPTRCCWSARAPSAASATRRSRGPVTWTRCGVDERTPHGRRSADVQPCLLVAEQQTRGRGRLGRGWIASAGASLTFSLALPLAPEEWSGLSLAVGLALAEALDPTAASPARRRASG